MTTTKAKLKLGRVNANEDEATLGEVIVKDGQRFIKDDLLFTLETTKAAVEVLAPSDGKMISFIAAEGAMLTVGSTVFEAEFEGEIMFEMLEIVDENVELETLPQANAAERKVSFKAGELAKSLDINLKLIPSAGNILKESDVRAYAERHGVIAMDNVLTGQVTAEITKRMPRYSAMEAIIFGAGGHAKSIIQLIRESGYSIAGVVDSKLVKGTHFMGVYPVLGTEADLKSIRSSGIVIAFVGVGGATGNTSRTKIFNKLKEAEFILPPLVSKMGNFDPTAHLDEASYVFPGATVGADCVIGKNVIINQGSIVCHDCSIDNNVHIAPGAILAGTVSIGANSTIGMGATIMNQVKIGADVLVHNTVAVAQDIAPRKIVTLNGIFDNK
jgi:sugar O-acyltransferase (sialic acid O-acetyltransferase NeuD family)